MNQTHPTAFHHQPRRSTRWLAALSAAAALGAAPLALASDHAVRPRVTLPAYQQECAACHTAYPPGMLPAQSWSRVMNGLDRHYGTDASLDAATVQQIAGWLQVHAGTDQRVRDSPPEDRITRSAWFERKHRRIDPQVWRHASVKSAANCVACHVQADRGHFDDDSIRFPKGLDARFRAGWHD
jgi:mono/diheme cytochrome c family protein